MLAVRMENCPHCNEPVRRTQVRTDHIGYKQSIAPLCKGAPTNAEVGFVELERDHWGCTEKEDVGVGMEPATTWASICKKAGRGDEESQTK